MKDRWQSTIELEMASCKQLRTAFDANVPLKEELHNDFINERMLVEFGREQCVLWFEELLASTALTPSFTTLRVNTLKTAAKQLVETLDKLLENDVFVHHDLADVLVIAPSAAKCEPSAVHCEVIVGCQCGIAVLRGAHVYAPGVTAAPTYMKVGDVVSVYADIENKCLRGATKTFEGKKIFIGNGVARVSRTELFVGHTVKPSGIAVEMTEPLSRCPSLDHLPLNLFFVQNLPSIVCSHVLDPKEGEWVLDMCAAPGGKCTHLAALMNDRGIIVALDKTQTKVNKIKCNAERMSITCISSFVFDATTAWNASADPCNFAEVVRGPPYASESFHRVLLDAPCSALGQRPQLLNRMTVRELRTYPALQKKLITNAVQLLKPGGTLVYSTCTFTFQENESLVHWVLNKFPSVELVDQNPRLGRSGLPWADLTTDQLNRLQRYGINFKPTPSSEQEQNVDTIGFFIAKFIKNLTDQ